MSEYRFNEIMPLDSGLLKEGVLLWIWYADKIPPHLGISVHGSYYSLKYNGKDQDMCVAQPLKVIRDRKISTLLINLDLPLTMLTVHAVFEMFDKAASNGATCLDPIKKSLSISNANTVFDLLNKLQSENKIKAVHGINLPDSYLGIPAYGIDEIRSRLIKLENASLGKHISSIG